MFYNLNHFKKLNRVDVAVESIIHRNHFGIKMI